MSGSVISDIQNAPIPQMLSSMGLAIAESQAALDDNAIRIAQQMAVPVEGSDLPSLLQLGFSPSFYQISEATIDIKVSLSMSKSKEFGMSMGVAAMGGIGFIMVGASVNVSMSNKYSYDASASSSMVARIVAIPPPSAFHNYLAQLGSTPNDPEPEPEPDNE